MASITVFSFFVLAFGLVWNVSVEDAMDRNNLKQAKGEYTSKILKSEGNPQDWNTSTVQTPGVYENGKLSRSKFSDLNKLNSSQLRDLLISSQQFRIQVQYLNGTYLDVSGDQFIINSTNKVPANKSVRVHRTLTLDQETGKRVKLSLYRWSS
jgi:hypothetical protein